MTDATQPETEVSDEAFEDLKRQVAELTAAITARDAHARDLIDGAINDVINPVLADLALRERAQGEFTLH